MPLQILPWAFNPSKDGFLFCLNLSLTTVLKKLRRNLKANGVPWPGQPATMRYYTA